MSDTEVVETIYGKYNKFEVVKKSTLLGSPQFSRSVRHDNRRSHMNIFNASITQHSGHLFQFQLPLISQQGVRVVHAIVLTNSNITNVATVTFFKNDLQTIVIKVPANGTVQVPLTSGLPFAAGDTFSYQLFYDNFIGIQNVLMTLDFSGS